jgi:hypothetical protein
MDANNNIVIGGIMSMDRVNKNRRSIERKNDPVV